MEVTEHSLRVRSNQLKRLCRFKRAVFEHYKKDEHPVRFVVTRGDDDADQCEVATLTKDDSTPFPSIFEFNKRKHEDVSEFNAVLIVPTGIGADIGGHAGDATPVARLLTSVCDRLITHPNVVNASDINELPDNGMYVEGSVLARLLMGTAGLQPVRRNRVLLVVDSHEDRRITDLAVNAMSAARATIGLTSSGVVVMSDPIILKTAYATSGRATGSVTNLSKLCDVLKKHSAHYDAIAIASVVDVPEEYHEEYFASHGEMVNPWGGVEAMLTHTLSLMFNKPVAHAPMLESWAIGDISPGLVDPRIAAEAISNCFLNCVLKGLHRSPRIITNPAALYAPDVLNVSKISCLIIPDGCVGLPTLAAMEQGIPVIAVKDNTNLMRNNLSDYEHEDGKLFTVGSYAEAAGVVVGLRDGLNLSSVCRPMLPTHIIEE